MNRDNAPLLGDVIEANGKTGTVVDIAGYSDAIEGAIIDADGHQHRVHFAHVSDGWNAGKTTRSQSWALVTPVAIPTDFAGDDEPDRKPSEFPKSWQVRAWPAGIAIDAVPVTIATGLTYGAARDLRKRIISMATIEEMRAAPKQ